MASERKEVSTERVLNNILIGYQQAEENFIAEKVFPIVPVKQSSGKYWEFDITSWNEARMQKRADGTKSASTKFKKTKKTYDTEAEALSIPITWKSLEEADDVLQLEKAHISFLHNQDMIMREQRFGTAFFTTGIWTGTKDGADITLDATEKFDQVGSDPIGVIRGAILGVKKKTGFRPNKVVAGAEVHEAIVEHPEVIERTKYTSNKSVTRDMIKELLEVDEYVVAEAVSSVDGEMGFVFDNHVLVCYTPKEAAKELPSAGYIFERRQKTTSRKVETIDLDEEKSTKYEIEDEFDMCLVCADCGALIADCLTVE